MFLYLDIGNTALKWRWRDQEHVAQGGCLHHRDWQKQFREMRAVLPSQPDEVRIGSVAGRAADSELADVVRQEFGIKPRFYYSPKRGEGLTNAYLEPAKLGVDRWLAIVEAWHRAGAAIVVDCGSAITLDVVDRSGGHGGGYIVPGLRMLEQSLVSGTGSVRIETPTHYELTAGVSTTECVHNGVLLMSVAFITDAVVALQRGVQDTCSIFMTGGDAAILHPHMTHQVELLPEIVLDGLERVFAN